jgi:outer membrane protein
MKRSIVLIVVVLALLLDMKSMAQVLSLRSAVETAIRNNITVQQSGFAMEREQVGWRQSKANFLPRINGNIDHTLNGGRSIDPGTNEYINQEYTSARYSLQGNLTLFNGLNLLNTLKASQYSYEASKWEWQQSKDRLTLDVILSYLNILSSQDLLDQAQKNAAVTQQQVDRLEIMNKEGAIAPATLYDLKGQLADSKLSVINAQNTVKANKLALAQLMNVQYNENLQVEKLTAEQFDMQYPSPPDSIFQVALQELGMVKAADLRKKSAEKTIAATRGALFPSVGLGAGINTNFSSTQRDASSNKIGYYDQLSNNYFTGIGIGISIPILNALRQRNAVTLAKIDLKQADVIAKSTQIQLKQAIEQDYFNMTASLSRYQALVEQVAAFTESFHAAEVRFNAGASTSVDYQIAKNNLDRSNINLIIARYDYVLRTKILDYYQNKLVW